MHPSQEKILKLLKANSELTHEQLANEIGVKSKSNIDYHLKNLIIAGRLRRGKKWEVLEKKK